MWPLGFWLPRTYAASAPAVAAMFALMTKVGIYVLLRLSLLLFGEDAGPASSHFGSDWLLWGGVATIIAGTVGMLGARDLGKLARSEEHTSELQSLMRTSYAVFCLKKKQQKHR